MEFIVATHSYLFRVHINVENEKIENYQVLNENHHYGIALAQNQVHVVKRINNDILLPQIDTYDIRNNQLLRSTTDLHQMNFGDIHQMIEENDGMHIVNTRFNSIVFYSFNGNKINEYFIDGKTEDINHINSVYQCGGLLFTLFHNRGRKESEIAIFKHDKYKGYTLQHLIPVWHTGCHNLFVDGNYLYYNASSKGLFVVVDLNKQRILKEISLPGHTKGMSVTDGYIVIGFSDHASREERFTTKGHLAFIDRKSLTLIHTIDLKLPTLPHNVGNVNEIRAISESEYAHVNQKESEIDWSSIKLAKSDLYFQTRKRLGKLYNLAKKVINK
ncbi:hypothetical protein SAMN05421676_12016 [Salinibacillus kushneri]|uniref:Uncharacterized protein n=1 Tax=Salinibacillus kushneri TaxID=237682 RepID=A0A1I0JHA6_9BACI|nr:hypothetical protein [Salinibacillus kushneri]SEU09471.1 hypothetical protein SAMN05421676_12016 [Salinibacillus kushneri]